MAHPVETVPVENPKRAATSEISGLALIAHVESAIALACAKPRGDKEQE